MTDKGFEREWQKMLAGEEYDAMHPRLLTMLEETRKIVARYNNSPNDDSAALQSILAELIGDLGEGVRVNQPFRCDYGCNVTIGDRTFINFNCTILDEARVWIGKDVLIGPSVNIYTPCHPIDPVKRRAGIQWAKSVRIEDNVWIGGNVTILPGVTIGENAVVGAGSVVTKDVKANTVVAGNPAKRLSANGA